MLSRPEHKLHLLTLTLHFTDTIKMWATIRRVGLGYDKVKVFEAVIFSDYNSNSHILFLSLAQPVYSTRLFEVEREV